MSPVGFTSDIAPFCAVVIRCVNQMYIRRVGSVAFLLCISYCMDCLDFLSLGVQCIYGTGPSKP